MTRLFIFAFASIYALTFPGPAAAYLDPGTGMMIIHIVIGAIAGIGITLRAYWHKVSSLFQSRAKPSGAAPEPPEGHG